MLFMDARIHTQTVLRALRILIQLLTDSSLKQKFHDGDIFGGWVNGFELISSEMKDLLSKSLHYFTPLKQNLQHPLPGEFEFEGEIAFCQWFPCVCIV